jgi:hypothetical protein
VPVAVAVGEAEGDAVGGIGVDVRVDVGVGVATSWTQVGHGSQAAIIMAQASTNSSEISWRLTARPVVTGL